MSSASSQQADFSAGSHSASSLSPSNAARQPRTTDLVDDTSDSVESPQRRPSSLHLLRSSSSGSASNLLQRITSRGSTHSKGENSQTPGSPNGLPGSPGRADRDALSQPKGKYKSGARIDPNLLPNFGYDAEAYQQTMDTPGEELEQQGDYFEENELNPQVRGMVAVGGTAALQSYYSNMGSTLSSVFPAQERALADAAKRAALAAHAFQPNAGDRSRRTSPTSNNQQYPRVVRLAGGSSQRPMIGHQRRSLHDRAQGSPPERVDEENEQCTGIEGQAEAQEQEQYQDQQAISRTTSASTSTPSLAIGQAQPPPPLPFDISSAAANEQESEETQGLSSTSSSKNRRSRAFLGLGSKSTDKVDKAGKANSKSRRGSKDDSATGSDKGKEAEPEEGPRRRYPNTRELNIVAAELAAEEALEARGMPFYAHQPYPGTGSGSHSPADRRYPYNGVNGAYSSSSIGRSPLQPVVPPFARPYANSPGSSNPGSPRGSLRAELTGSLAPSKVAAPTRSGASSPRSYSSMTPLPATGERSMPSEMLSGLGDGPYPVHRGGKRNELMDDPYQSSDISSPPSGAATPRRRSGASWPANTANGASTDAIVPSPGADTPNGSFNGRRSVLSMSMVNPDTELQGLAKPYKSGKSTPWGSRGGSRAGSRAPSPNTSVTNLTDSMAKGNFNTKTKRSPSIRSLKMGRRKSSVPTEAPPMPAPLPVFVTDPTAAAAAAAGEGEDSFASSRDLSVASAAPRAPTLTADIDQTIEPLEVSTPKASEMPNGALRVPRDTATSPDAAKNRRSFLFGSFGKGSGTKMSKQINASTPIAGERQESNHRSASAMAVPFSASFPGQSSYANSPASSGLESSYVASNGNLTSTEGSSVATSHLEADDTQPVEPSSPTTIKRGSLPSVGQQASQTAAASSAPSSKRAASMGSSLPSANSEAKAKRPGGLKRLLSKFGSQKRVPTVTSDGDVPPVPKLPASSATPAVSRPAADAPPPPRPEETLSPKDNGSSTMDSQGETEKEGSARTEGFHTPLSSPVALAH